MKKLSLYSLLLFYAVCNSVQAAAQQQIRLQFLDKATNSPVNSVSIITQDGIQTATSDRDGFATLSAPGSKYLVAVHKGYKPDTLRNITSAVIYLKPLSVTMDDVVVTNKKVRRILRSAAEYVVDYDFVGDNILVASYSGNNGKNAKLFLLNSFGDTLALQKFPDEPLALFKSCTGNYYCVCTDRLYPLDIQAGKILLRNPYSISILPFLKQCEQSIDNTFYYHSIDKEAFSSVYSLRNMRDTATIPFYKIERYKDANGNIEEQQEIAIMLASGNFRGAARLNGVRGLRNITSYRSLGLPLYRNADSLIIFDFDKRLVNYFNPAGTAIASAGIGFDPGKTFRVSIVQDLPTGKFYLYDHRGQTLEEINMRSGKKQGPEIALGRPFAEKVKVHKGNIYYLWQDQQNSSTRQLFMQDPY